MTFWPEIAIALIVMRSSRRSKFSPAETELLEAVVKGGLGQDLVASFY